MPGLSTHQSNITPRGATCQAPWDVSDPLQNWGHIYIESFFSLVVFAYKTKTPIANPENQSWWIIDSDEQLESVLKAHPKINLALRFDDSCKAIAVEWDSPAGSEKAKQLGVTNRDLAWIRRSPRGYAVIYRKPDNFDLPNFNDQGYPLEFIRKGTLLVPPSVHPQGKPYHWVKGHSPRELWLCDLNEPPDTLLAEWRMRISKRGSRPTRMPVPSRQLQECLMAELEVRGANLRERHDGQWTGHCPLHDDRHASFSINFDKGAWCCFAGCGQGSLCSLAERLGLRISKAHKPRKQQLWHAEVRL
jgi:hypothetical protein